MYTCRSRQTGCARAGSLSGMLIIGALVGLAGAVALSKVLASFMFGVSALDSATFVGVALLLTLVAGLALYLPNRRAATVDPVIVLREA
jgi:putative ABC transport system permease protein